MKKRDSEVISISSGTSKGSDHRKGSTFSLRRIFHVRRPQNRSKSRASLDSDSTRSEASLNVVSEPPPPPPPPPPPLPVVPCPPISVSLVTVAPLVKPRENCRECPVCMNEQEFENFPEIMTCHHRTCRDCLKQYLQIEISESRVNITCPECAERFHPNDIQMILRDEILMTKYEDFMLRRVLAMDPDARWCPAPDCGYAVIATGCAGCPKLKCDRQGCDTHFCYHCKQYWHPNQTCDAARAERSPNVRSPSLSYTNETGSQNDIKPCPRCGAFIVKMNDGSCNHMTCAVCGAEFCWLCMKEISDLHYLSPSGCTFWGKKPWSRKKKILWQLGTLVGAPVGITLVAGIAVPAMIIGIPVWVGRKLHSRYEDSSSKHKRNLAITGGVAASIIISPIIAGLAVGIGVPILLAYVYGVVPISLCRSGGCGVTTTNTGGVRFEFDEEAEGAQSGKYQDGGDNHSVGANVANPSIAPSIGEASMGMTNSLSASGSHMDRVGAIRDESDRDSASNRAIAGSSLNGSLCGSTYATLAAYQNKLEVQADVSSNHMSHSKRASFSSESANISLSEKSATVSFYDDASTRALAGSIAGYSNKDNVSLLSRHTDGNHGDDCLSLCQDCTSDTKSQVSQGDCHPHSAKHNSASQPNSPGLARSVSNSFDHAKPTRKCHKCTRFQDTEEELDVNSRSVEYATSKRVENATSKHVQVVGNAKSDVDSGIHRVPVVKVLTTQRSADDDTCDSTKEIFGEQRCKRFDSCSSHGSCKGDSITQVETDRPLDGSQSDCAATSRPINDASSPNDLPLTVRRRHSCEMAYKDGRLSPTHMK